MHFLVTFILVTTSGIEPEPSGLQPDALYQFTPSRHLGDRRESNPQDREPQSRATNQ